MTGETVLAVCRRLRLARSLPRLADRDVSIAVAAAGAGYATSQGYARAMQQAAGSSATAILHDPVQTRRVEDALRHGPDTGAPLDVEIVPLEPFEVAAMRRAGPYENLDEGYDALVAAVFERIDPARLRGILGIPLDVGGGAIGHDDVTSLTFGGITALSLNHKGSYDDVHALFDPLCEAALHGALELTDQ